MKPMIGLSVLLLMLVGSTSILHSATSEPFNSKIRRYADDMGIPAGALPVAQQSQATLESETEEIGPAVNDPNQAQVLIQNNEPDQDPGTINQAVSTLQTAEIPDQQQSLQPQIQQQLPQTQIQPQILEQQILQQQQIQQQQIQQQQQQQQQQIQQQQQQIQQQQQQIQQQQQQQVQQQQLQQQVGVQESSARGLGSSLSTDQAIVDAGEVSQNQAPPPKIIENGSEVILPPNQQVFVASQQQQQQQQLQSLSAQSSVNETIVPSTARTYGFEGWTNCNGESSGKSGVCKNDVDCRQLKGHAEGSCMGGLGVCCVIALSCGDKSSENNTFFANPDFPESSWDARLCEVEIKKKSKSISQVLIEFEHFELALPDYEGECVTDIFQVKLASNRYSPYSNIRLCGMNTGQHLYLDVSQIDDPIVLSVATSGSNHARRWSIKIIQMDDKNYLQAPPGCLQYYTDTTGIVRSFNLGKNLRSLYYAICFRIDNGYSGIRFTDNYFGMSGGECSTPTSRLNMMAGPHRKKLIHHQSPTVQPTQYQPQQMTTTQYPGSQQQQGGYSHPYNPHHLVIAPPGHLPQLPPPSYGGGSSGYMSAPLVYNGAQLVSSPGRRFRRQVALDLDGQPMKRSFWSSSSSEPKKEETKPMKQEETTYSPTNNGGYNVYPTDYPQHMKFSHENKHHHQHMQQPSGYPTTYSPYGGASPSFYGSYYNQPPSNHYNQQQMGQYGSTPAMRYSPYGMTGQNYQQQSSVHEKFRTAGHQGGHMKHHHQHHHQQGLHHQQTGQPYMQYPSYGQNGGAYHKEIDRFGKKYEEIYYQHEKNHNKMKEDRYYENNYQHYENKNFKKDDKKNKKDKDRHHEVAFPELELLEPPHCEPRSCSNSDVITFPPSFGSTAEMCGNQFNRGRGPVVVSGSPLVVYVNSRGRNRGFGFDLYYEQVFAIPHQHY